MWICLPSPPTRTTGAGERGYTRYALDLAGRSDVPVAAGADIASGYYRFEPGLPNEADYWPEPIPPVPTPLDAALDFLEHSIAQGAIIAAVGPYTNLALLGKALAWHPPRCESLADGRLRLPDPRRLPGLGQQHGLEHPGGQRHRRNTSSNASSPALVPLSITVETALRRSYLPALRQAGPLARLIAHQAEAFACEYRLRDAIWPHVRAVTRRHHQLAARPVGLRHRVGLE